MAGRRPRGELRFVVGVDHGAGGVAVRDRHPRELVTSVAVGAASIDRPLGGIYGDSFAVGAADR